MQKKSSSWLLVRGWDLFALVATPAVIISYWRHSPMICRTHPYLLQYTLRHRGKFWDMSGSKCWVPLRIC